MICIEAGASFTMELLKVDVFTSDSRAEILICKSDR